jgi:hypothetical protein
MAATKIEHTEFTVMLVFIILTSVGILSCLLLLIPYVREKVFSMCKKKTNTPEQPNNTTDVANEADAEV